MSLHRPSLRLAFGLALFVLATTVAPASAAPRQVAATPAPAAFPASSCQGTGACDGAAGPIGENSCNGDYACRYSLGAIGDNSCNALSACDDAYRAIGDNSCNGVYACYEATSDIGNCVYNTVQPAACDTQPDARIRRVGRHNLVGNDIYNTDATDQTLTATLKPGDKVRFSITIQNDSAVADSFTLGAICGAKGTYAVDPAVVLPGRKFVTGRPGQDITTAVGDGSYETRTVAPGGTFRLRAVVNGAFTSSALGTAATTEISCLLMATSVGNPANADAVKFIVNIESTPS